jgi:hypothetical protein
MKKCFKCFKGDDWNSGGRRGGGQEVGKSQQNQGFSVLVQIGTRSAKDCAVEELEPKHNP